MERKLSNNSKQTVILISISVFLAVLGIILLIISMAVNKQDEYPDKNDFLQISSTPSYTEEFFSEISDVLKENSEYSDASDVFIESISDVVTDVPDEQIEHGWVINKYGYTYLYGDTGFEQFNYSSKVLDRYAESLNSISNIMPSESRIFNITVPVSTTFADIPRDIYVEDDFYNKSQSAFVSTVESKLSDKITNIPIVSEIEEKIENDEYVFFRTDNNWTSVGAYTAYVEYCKSADINAYSLNSFAKNDLGEFLGRFYTATESENMKNNPDKFISYSTIPAVKTSLKVFDNGIVYDNFSLCNNEIDLYSAFDYYLGMPAGRYQICTTLTEGKNLLIIGDSSAYPLIPFLAAHYARIEMIDPQYFEGSLTEFISTNQFEDVLTICYSTNATSGNYIPAFNIFTEVNNNE